MRTLNWYITKSLLLTTAIAVGVLTFVMLSANLVRSFELLARGVSPGTLAQLSLYLIPVTLKFTVPLGVLCSSVLVFSRLSADNEIMAMRASGISLWQIISPALLLSVVLCVICFYLQMDVAPRCLHRAVELKRSEGVRNPVALLEPGRFIELPGCVVYVGAREGGVLTDIHIYNLGPHGHVMQDIVAQSGRIQVDETARSMSLVLKKATIISADPAAPGDPSRVHRLAGQDCELPLEYGASLDHRPLVRKTKYMDSGRLFSCIHIFTRHEQNTTPLYVELHARMSMALSPLAFLLIGIPFGIRTRRSETSIGLTVSLVLALFFYVFLVLAESLENQTGQHPELLVWLPNIIYQVGGLWALGRIAKR